MVECGGLENHCTARYRGFDSLSLRLKPKPTKFGFFNLLVILHYMKLLFLISFIFLIDLYFYFGVISFFEKQPVGQVIFKISYWLLSLVVYVAYLSHVIL